MSSRKCPAFVKPAVIVAIAILLVTAAVLTGCKLSNLTGKDTNETVSREEVLETKEEKKEEKTGEKQEEPAPAPIFNVLTGLETTSELAALRPVAVCYANNAYSLPQYGLSSAEILVEVPLSDGGTRLVMLTSGYNRMTTIGAVAGATQYIADICDLFEAVPCYNGSEDEIIQAASETPSVMDYASGKLAGVFYYDETRFLEDDLMTNGILLDSGFRRLGIEQTSETLKSPFLFAEVGKTVSPGKSSAARASIRYSDDLLVGFAYDTETGKYIRSEFGEVQTDAGDKSPLAYDNLFILFSTTVTYEDEDGKKIDLVIRNGGAGIYISHGTSAPVVWSREADGHMAIRNEDGSDLVVNRGSSYIGFVSAGAKKSVTVE